MLAPLEATAEVAWSCRTTPLGDDLQATVFRFRSDDLPIAGFALRFESPRMRNVEPFGLATLFQDNNAAFRDAGEDAEADTQWLYHRYGRGPRRILVAPNDLTREGDGFIQGDFELIDKTEHARDAVRVVAPVGDPIRFHGVVGVADGRPGHQRRKEAVSGSVGGPGGRAARCDPARSNAGPPQ